MQYWTCPPAWQGETAFIIGGGPSLREFDIERLLGRRVIVINNAYTLAPWADFLFFADNAWWGWHGEALKKGTFGGRIVTVCKKAKAEMPSIFLMEREGRTGVPSRRTGLCGSFTSLAYVLCLCRWLGVGRAVLLGFDMGFQPGGPSHWHDGHPKPADLDHYDRMLESLATVVGPMAVAGVEIVNATPVGRLETLWPRRPIEEVL